jgi:hypothetical protein
MSRESGRSARQTDWVRTSLGKVIRRRDGGAQEASSTESPEALHDRFDHSFYSLAVRHVGYVHQAKLFRQIDREAANAISLRSTNARHPPSNEKRRAVPEAMPDATPVAITTF